MTRGSPPHGQQYAAYVKLALGAARKEDRSLVDLGHAMGTLVQIVADWQTGDSRWTGFGEEERSRIWKSVIEPVRAGTNHPIAGELAPDLAPLPWSRSFPEEVPRSPRCFSREDA